MRVTVAGATGVIGRALVPLLRKAGHEVTALTRTPAKATALERSGVRTIMVDAFDADALTAAVVSARPEVVIHQLTALPQSMLRPIAAMKGLVLTNRLRARVSPVLVEAASRAGVRRVVAQSIAFAYRPGPGVRTEGDPLFSEAGGLHGRSIDAVVALEQAVLKADGVEGIVLRYGALTGTGTYYAPDGSFISLIRRRLFPLVDGGHGVFGFVDVEDAARATVAAIEGPLGVFNIVDDEPVEAATWVPAVAEALGAGPPRRLSGALAGIGPGRALAYLVAHQPAVSNQRARAELRWEPEWRTWREGLLADLAGDEYQAEEP